MKHKGSLLPLALMAFFALMIPFYTMTRNANSLKESHAMRLTVPTNEPHYEMNDINTVRPSIKPNATPKPMKYGY